MSHQPDATAFGVVITGIEWPKSPLVQSAITEWVGELWARAECWEGYAIKIRPWQKAICTSCFITKISEELHETTFLVHRTSIGPQPIFPSIKMVSGPEPLNCTPE